MDETKNIDKRRARSEFELVPFLNEFLNYLNLGTNRCDASLKLFSYYEKSIVHKVGRAIIFNLSNLFWIIKIVVLTK